MLHKKSFAMLPALQENLLCHKQENLKQSGCKIQKLLDIFTNCDIYTYYYVLDNDDISLQFCNDTEYDYDKLGEAVHFISSNSSMYANTSKCNILVNLPMLKELVVVIDKEDEDDDRECSISYRILSHNANLDPLKSFCQQQRGTNIYANHIFVRQNVNPVQEVSMFLNSTQHLNFTITGYYYNLHSSAAQTFCKTSAKMFIKVVAGLRRFFDILV